MLSFMCRLRVPATSAASSSSSTAEATITRSTLAGSSRPSWIPLAEQLSTMWVARTWISGKRSSFFSTLSALLPLPTTIARSGGVTRRHTSRAAERRTSASAATASQRATHAFGAVGVSLPTTTVPIVRIALPVTAHTRRNGSSPLVRCRSERWSRS